MASMSAADAVAMSVMRAAGSIPISTVGIPGRIGRRREELRRGPSANVHVGDAGCWGMSLILVNLFLANLFLRKSYFFVNLVRRRLRLDPWGRSAIFGLAPLPLPADTAAVD